MGSNSPKGRNSRRSGPAECSSARTEGSRRRIAAESSRQRGERAATKLPILKDWERCINRDQSLIAHLLPVFSPLVWNSANVRAVAWPHHSSAPASALYQLPPSQDPASSAQSRFSPTSFEPRRNPALPAMPAIPSLHHPSCLGGGQFPRVRGVPQRCRDRRPQQPKISSPQPPLVPAQPPPPPPRPPTPH